MTQFTNNEAVFLGTVLEGFFYGKSPVPSSLYPPLTQCYTGLYVVIFSLYVGLLEGKQKIPIFYALCFLFGICTCFVGLDFTEQYFTLVSG